MNRGVVIDANIFCDWYYQYLIESGPLYDFVASLLVNTGIAIDDKDIIRNEWCDRGDKLAISDWIDDQLIAGRIRMIRAEKIDNHERYMHINYGFDRHSRDSVYIRVANETADKHIFSRDIHLFEPSEAASSPDRRNMLMDRQQGRMCKYLKRKMGITVCTSKRCIDFIITLQNILQ